MTIVIEQLSLGGNGLSVMVKDTIDVAGRVTRASSQALDDAAPADTHADVVQALLDKGCHLVGKTSLHELAFGTTGINHWTGTAPNPRFPTRIPGGLPAVRQRPWPPGWRTLPSAPIPVVRCVSRRVVVGCLASNRRSVVSAVEA